MDPAKAGEGVLHGHVRLGYTVVGCHLWKAVNGLLI